jgi:hypothetical protein
MTKKTRMARGSYSKMISSKTLRTFTIIAKKNCIEGMRLQTSIMKGIVT